MLHQLASRREERDSEVGASGEPRGKSLAAPARSKPRRRRRKVRLVSHLSETGEERKGGGGWSSPRAWRQLNAGLGRRRVGWWSAAACGGCAWLRRDRESCKSSSAMSVSYQVWGKKEEKKGKG